jgi:hypothetical protein
MVASKSSAMLKRAMALTTLGMLIDFDGADMRLKNRTRASLNTNLSARRQAAARRVRTMRWYR